MTEEELMTLVERGERENLAVFPDTGSDIAKHI